LLLSAQALGLLTVLANTLLGGLLALAILIPLAWKWGLDIARTVLAGCVLALLAGPLVEGLEQVGLGLPLPGAAVVSLLVLALATGTLLYFFHRDPERVPPEEEGVLVSPADGAVVYLRESTDGSIPVSTKRGRRHPLEELTKTPLRARHATIVGIGLSFVDVHVTRAPTAGRVASLGHYPGGFRSLRLPESVFENERATAVIEQGPVQVAVVMIASRLVRRITTFIREGQEVACGERLAAIRFGSQVDVVIPDDAGFELAVAEGDRVTAGVTVLARLPEPGGNRANRRD